MATAFVTFTNVMGAGAPVYASKSSAAQKFTSSGTSQTTNGAALGGDYVSVTSSGGAIAIAIGPSPTAVSGAAGTHFIPDGVTKDFGPLVTGDKVALIDA